MKADMTALEKYLDEMFRRKKFLGMAIAIRGPRGLIFRKGFGFRNRERTLVPDGNTIFEFMI